MIGEVNGPLFVLITVGVLASLLVVAAIGFVGHVRQSRDRDDGDDEDGDRRSGPRG